MSTPHAKRRACERCWKRKQKCDRQNPTCQLCREAAVECRDRTISAGSDDDDAAFVGESYIQTLKRKIDHLDGRRRDKRPRTAVETPIPDEPESSAGASVASVHNALADLGHFGVNTTPRDPDTADWRPKPFSAWSLAHTVVQWSYTGSVGQDAAINGSLTADQQSSLSSEATLPLMKKYIDSVLCMFPFIDTRDLILHHDRFVQSPMACTDPHGALLTSLVLATACTRHRRATHVELMTRSVISKLCASMSERHPVASMQCLVAAALYAFHGTTIESASYLVRLALSKAIALGFHRSQTQDSEDKWRIIAVLYVLDRSIGFAVGQPPALDDCDIAPDRFEQGQMSANCLLLYEAMHHCRLLNMLRHSGKRSPMYFATTYRTWVETTSLAQNVCYRETFIRLRCRLLVAAHHTMTPDSQIPAQDSNETHEMLETFHEWLQCLEARQDLEDAFWSVLDPYEIASVGIVTACVHLKQMYTNITADQISHKIQLLAISLLSFLSGHFSAAAPMRKILAAIFNKQSVSSDGNLPRKLREMLHTYSAAIS